MLNKNRIVYISLISLCMSCSDNSFQINQYKNFVINELLAETAIENNEIDGKIERLLLKERALDCIHSPQYLTLTNYKNKKDAFNTSILNKQQFRSQFIQTHTNQLLYNLATYTEWKYEWELDTIKVNLETCNPKDTSTINRIINHSSLLYKGDSNSGLTQLTLMQSNLTVFNHWLERIDGSYFISCGYNRVDELLYYNNKVYFQNEENYVLPGIFTYEKSDPYSIHIFKENSTEFIMENGEKKTFTNPITLKASSKKGVHTVKGVVMIKQKGELIPKPFEFRYIVK